MTQVRCPSCGTLQTLPEGVGAAVFQCRACQMMFRPPAAPAQAAPDPIPPHLRPRSSEPSPAQGPAIAPVTLATDPSEPAFGPRSSRSSQAVLWGVAAFCLVMFVALGSVLVVYLVRFGPPVTPGTEVGFDRNSNGQQLVVIQPRARGPAHWYDALRFALWIDEVRVRVDRAEWGVLRGKDVANQVVTTDEPVLMVHLDIRYSGSDRMEYLSWYGNTFRGEKGLRRVEMSDNQGRPCDVVVFGGIEKVEGHVSEYFFGPNERAEDLLVFSLPEGAAQDEIQYFLLELPAEAAGRSGTYRFEIPRSMIVGF